MEWQKVTAPEFVKAVDACKSVCIVPLGCLEKHGDHLPLGTDNYNIYRKAVLASEIEPAMVFPTVIFTENKEAKNNPGAVAIEPDVYYRLLENICDEIARNGYKKIILLSGHGGNRFFLPFFVQQMIDKGKDYVVYYPGSINGKDHGGEDETSQLLYNFPELVKKEAIPPEPGLPLMRSKVPGIMTSVDWFADFPRQYQGDARTATVDKGKMQVERAVNRLVDIIKAVKADDTTLSLMQEYLRRTKQ